MKAPEIVILAVVFLAAAELTSRVEDWVEHRTPIDSPFTSQNDLLIRDADGVHGRPNARFEKWSMNALGMRGPAAEVEKPAGTIRVVTAGASETFGVYESPGLEFPRQLERSLRDLVAAGRCDPGIADFEVLNAAFRGMTLPTVTQDLDNRILRLAPDVVVYYPTPTQYLQIEVPTAAVPDSTGAGEALPGGAIGRVRFFHRFRTELGQMMPGFVRSWSRARRLDRTVRAQPDGWLFDTVPDDRLAAYEAGLRDLVATTRDIGSALVLATHANAFPPGEPRNDAYLDAWSSTYPRATAEVVAAFDSLAALTTARVAAESGVVLSDVRSRMYGEGPGAFGDFSHFTDEGSAAVAGTLAQQVIAALTPTGAPPICR